MLDRTDHNRLAEQFSARIAAETAISLPPQPMTRAKVATEGLSKMSILQPAVSSSAFLKMGVLGFQGGGKTLTSAKCLIGLYKHTLEMGLHDGTKPVAMIDTEKGSDWLIPIFAKAGVPFVVAKRKAFADLLKVMDEAETEAFALLIDSVTHPWRELVESYLRKKERSYLAMDDWGYLKGEHGWQQFTDRFVNSKLHIVMAGRAGFEYENYVEDGRKKMEKVGTKMKTEGETGYEPDLLVLMEQVEDLRTGKVVHRATVQKDRSTLLDGMQFDNPDFASFLPHVRCLALGQPHIGVGAAGDSQHLLKLQRRDWQPIQRKIVLDETQNLLLLHVGGQATVDKQRRITLLKTHFGAGWVEIEETMPLPDLRAGYDSLHRELAGNPSKYANAIDAEKVTPMNDAIPDHSAARIEVSAELATSKLVQAGPIETGTVDTTTLAANGMPAFLVRDPDKVEAPAFDEAKWLADVTRDFGKCMDLVEFGQKQIAMAADRAKVTAENWGKAVKIVTRNMGRLMNAQVALSEAAE